MADDAPLVRDAPPAARFILRGDILRGNGAVALRAGTTFGVDLPNEPCRSARSGGRAALWLGPDEWLLLGDASDAPAIAAALGDVLAATPHSLVEVSDRDVALLVSGPRAALLLCAGCPLDLDAPAFPVGMATRTLLGRIGIVLWRLGVHEWRVEMGRSIAAYASDFLAEAARGLPQR